jgi:hypothetical protein
MLALILKRFFTGVAKLHLLQFSEFGLSDQLLQPVSAVFTAAHDSPLWDSP